MRIPTQYRLRLILRLLLLASGLFIVAGCVAIGDLWFLRNREVILPSPGGPYAVGRVEYDWTDASRVDPLEGNAPQPRRLNVWIWYPGEAPSSIETPASYLPQAWIAAREQVSGIGTLLMQSYAHVQGHSTADLPLSTAQTAYPVLILQPGLGPIIADYTTLAETLASYGYIVVGSTPTGSANVVVFNDGQVAPGTPQGNVPDNASIAEVQHILGSLIQVWAADDGFVLDQVARLNVADPAGRFTGRIELDKVGVFGHSLGGAAAAEFCYLDSRCKAGVDLDGYLYGDVVQAGLSQPFMFVWSEPPDPKDQAWLRAKQDAEAIFEDLPPGSIQAVIQGTRHFNFADYAVEFQPFLHLLGELGPIDGAYGLEIITRYVHAFFNEALQGLADPLLEAAVSPYPEAQIERR